MKSKWMTVKDLAVYLSISKESIYLRLEEQRIPAHKIGRQWRFDSNEIDNWVKSGAAEEKPKEDTNASLEL